jgi:hypothetical protein
LSGRQTRVDGDSFEAANVADAIDCGRRSPIARNSAMSAEVLNRTIRAAKPAFVRH